MKSSKKETRLTTVLRLRDGNISANRPYVVYFLWGTGDTGCTIDDKRFFVYKN